MTLQFVVANISSGIIERDVIDGHLEEISLSSKMEFGGVHVVNDVLKGSPISTNVRKCD